MYVVELYRTVMIITVLNKSKSQSPHYTFYSFYNCFDYNTIVDIEWEYCLHQIYMDSHVNISLCQFNWNILQG